MISNNTIKQRLRISSLIAEMIQLTLLNIGFFGGHVVAANNCGVVAGSHYSHTNWRLARAASIHGILKVLLYRAIMYNHHT
jgi:hypothetical protein